MAKKRTKRTTKRDENDERRKEQEARFLLAYVETGSVSAAAKKVGEHRERFYEWRAKDEEFKTLWRDAEDKVLADKADQLAESALQRAIYGYRKPLFHKGEAVMDPEKPGQQAFVRVFSPALAIFMLTHLRPDRFTQKALDQLRAKVGDKEIEITFGPIGNGQPEAASAEGDFEG